MKIYLIIGHDDKLQIIVLIKHSELSFITQSHQNLLRDALDSGRNCN
ncbi:TPA: hypothetical protein K0O58_001277 [Legionella pneumophila]|nr:hypothetical protein [Legionella pneumophila]HDV6632862.1 hypothetical protein [Legionella pneumophila]